jgi:hypothetical protein
MSETAVSALNYLREGDCPISVLEVEVELPLMLVQTITSL